MMQHKPLTFANASPRTGPTPRSLPTASPRSERYPDGVKYSMQYGHSDAPEGEDGTIIRYDNFPDHPGAPLHHKHTEDGEIERVDYDGVLDLYHDFKEEVRNHGEPWN